jgi:hypothetical protein
LNSELRPRASGFRLQANKTKRIGACAPDPLSFCLVFSLVTGH